VRPNGPGDLVTNSIRKLDEYWGRLVTMYDGGQIAGKCYVNLAGEDLPHLNGSRVKSVNELVDHVLDAMKGA
jgi:hypothetical protein